MSADGTPGSHPPPEQLRAFNLGRLSDEDAVRIGSHLDGCPACCALLRGLPGQDAFVGRVRAAADSSASGRTALGARPPQRLGDYSLVREIGRGGMGVVYEAEQRSLGRRVALKVLTMRAPTGRAALERFRREARLAARLHHTHIVPVFEVGQEGDTCFYAMQYIAGQGLDRVLGRLRGVPAEPTAGAMTDLSDRLARTMTGGLVPAPPPESGRSDDTPVPAVADGPDPLTGLVGRRAYHDAVARIGVQVAEALAYAHARGVLHRDVKPSNLVLDQQGTVWVTDFGLAKGEDDGLTRTGDFLGTLRYMAPERFQGKCDARADVYGLGLTLYELLTLRPGFDSSDQAELIDRICHRGPPRPRAVRPEVPRDLETVVLKAMDRDPARRYQSAAELADDLHRYLDGRQIVARRVGPAEQVARWARRHPAVAALLAAVVVTLVGGIAVSTYFAAQAEKDAQAAVKAGDAARDAEGRAVASDHAARRQAAALLLDRGVALANKGEVGEALHWMLAALRTSPDADFQLLVRTHLASWGQRADTLQCWVDTRHRHAALSPNGRRLATAGTTGGAPPDNRVTVQFWDAEEGRPEGEPLRTEDLCLGALSFSPDGRLLLSVSAADQPYQGKPGWASRYDVAGRRLLDLSLGHRSTVTHATWDPTGKRFATASWDQKLRLWDGATGRALSEPAEVGGWLSEAPLAFSPDGETVLVVSQRGSAVVELATGQVREVSVSGPAGSAAFSPDGKLLLVGHGRSGRRSTAAVVPWDPVAHAPAGPPRRGPGPAAKLSFLTDGRVAPAPAALAAPDGSLFARAVDGVQLWRPARARARPLADLSTLTGQYAGEAPVFLAVHFSPDRSRCWTVGAGARAQAWDVATGRPVGIPLPHVPYGVSGRIALTPDGRLAATEQPGGGQPHPPTVVWDVRSGRPVCPPLPQKNLVTVVEFSPDRRVLATGGHYRTVDLWDVSTGQPLRPPLKAGHMVMHAAFSPDGKSVAAATYAQEVRVWDVESGEQKTLAHPEIPFRVVYSPDGTRLLALCGSAAHLWDARTGERVGGPMAYPPSPDGLGEGLRGLFSPDGTVVLLCSGYGSFRLWDAATTKPLAAPTPAGEPERTCFAFSPDGRMVVAGHEDGTAQLWEVPGGRPIGAPAACAGRVHGVAFAPDGRSFWTVAGSGTIRSWPVPAPYEGDVERLAHSLRLATGLRMDEAETVVPLTPAQWQEERRRWRESEGDAPWGLARAVSDAEWHEARACDAEEWGNGFTVRWHLDRLIALRPDDWMLYARRARSWTEENRPDLAADDYRRVRELAPAEALSDWYRHRAWVCRSRKCWESAVWYLDRLLEEHPGDADLQRDRDDAAAQVQKQAHKP
jgi:serine/threonine protein kinase/WD40 repeat protein